MRIFSYIIIAVLSILLLTKSCESHQLKRDNQLLEAEMDLAQAKNQSTIFVIDSLTAKNEVLTSENLQLLELNEELRLSKRKPIYITQYKDRVLFKDSANTQVVYRDTSLRNIPAFELPIYKGEFADEWIAIRSISDAFSTEYELAVNTDVVLSHTEKAKFLGLGKPTLEVFARSNNPYSVDSEVSSYTITSKPRLFIAPAFTITYDPFSSKIVPGVGISISHSSTTLKIPLRK